MGFLTAQMITAYYNRFKDIEVVFTKDLIQTTGLISEQAQLKCSSDFWPCVLIATSFQAAKVVANIKSGLLEKLKKANNSVSLRLCFKNMDEKGDSITFFIAGRVLGTVPYKNSDDVYLLNIQFTQRPPDYLIEVIGRMQDANINAAKQKDEKIIITTESQRKLKLTSRETVVFIQGVPRRCILRELTFKKAKLIMVGVAKFMVGKEVGLRLDFEDPRESIPMKGKFSGAEDVEGKKEMLVLTMEFNETPTNYKIRVNEYLNATRLDNRVPSGGVAETSAQAKSANTESDVNNPCRERKNGKRLAYGKFPNGNTEGDLSFRSRKPTRKNRKYFRR